uniref:Uncharacterized protein n=1 Tax=Rhizophora mucronata TaxID=61149 RepID=A0A2P2PQU1_RHIMU
MNRATLDWQNAQEDDFINPKLERNLSDLVRKRLPKENLPRS